MSFVEQNINDLLMKPVAMFGEEWALVTAGDEAQGYNTMTISWGHIGNIWTGGGGGASMCVYVRPQRHTKQFMDKHDYFTVSVLTSGHKDALSYLGTKSGRDEDKVANAGLTPVFGTGITYFNESRLVFVCKKLYQAPIVEDGFMDADLVHNVYPDKDFHTMYVGKIVNVLAQE